jgi:quercetin dioxygenase-like cupin family protein
MTVPVSSLTALSLGPEEGRTPEPLDIFGQMTLVKLTSADTDAAVAVLRLTAPPMSGPPLHRHSREDEWFYILEGELTFEVDGKRHLLRDGGSEFAPRGIAHTYQNFTNTTAKLLVMTTPGGFSKFFEALSAANKGLAVPDLARSEQIMNEYGMEILGPPLS